MTNGHVNHGLAESHSHSDFVLRSFLCESDLGCPFLDLEAIQQ